jgi:hypothetical protein
VTGRARATSASDAVTGRARATSASVLILPKEETFKYDGRDAARDAAGVLLHRQVLVAQLGAGAPRACELQVAPRAGLYPWSTSQMPVHVHLLDVHHFWREESRSQGAA